jgi:hypothetical protein
MSTFTTIKTAIRDRDMMRRILGSIPDARVDENVVVPVKSGGFGTADFRVALGDSPVSVVGVLGHLLRGKGLNVRLFFVTRMEDGTYRIEINQDLAAHAELESAVEAALGSNLGQQAIASAKGEDERRRRVKEEGQLRRQREREESGRLARATAEDEEKHRREAQDLGRRAAEGAAAADARRKGEVRLQEESRKRTAVQAAEAREEAARVLAKLDHSASSAVSEGSATQGRSGAGGVAAEELERVTGSLNQAIAQEYAKQKILDQLDDVQSRHGVSLSGIETLADGTIEITLQG